MIIFSIFARSRNHLRNTLQNNHLPTAMSTLPHQVKHNRLVRSVINLFMFAHLTISDKSAGTSNVNTQRPIVTPNVSS